MEELDKQSCHTAINEGNSLKEWLAVSMYVGRRCRRERNEIKSKDQFCKFV